MKNYLKTILIANKKKIGYNHNYMPIRIRHYIRIVVHRFVHVMMLVNDYYVIMYLINNNCQKNRCKNVMFFHSIQFNLIFIQSFFLAHLVDELFEQASQTLLYKRKQLYDKFRFLILKDSMVSVFEYGFENFILKKLINSRNLHLLLNK